MATFRIDPGRLSRRLVLEAPTAAPDGAGGIVTGFRTVARLFAAVDPLGPAEQEDTGFATWSRRLQVTLRYRSDLATGQRFRLGSRILVLESVTDPDETGRYLTCICREDQP